MNMYGKPARPIFSHMKQRKTKKESQYAYIKKNIFIYYKIFKIYTRKIQKNYYWNKTIKYIDHNKLRNHYNQYYHPRNMALVVIGNFDKSNRFLNENIKNFPNFIKSHYVKSIVNNYSENEEHLIKMLEVSKINKLTVEDKININYAIGKAYEDKKDFKNSYKYLNEANKFQHELSPFSIDKLKNLFEKIKTLQIQKCTL